MTSVRLLTRRSNNQRGASLVEFAILLPLLLALLLGIVEFSWGVAQQLDLRHKSREGLRVAIVNGTPAEVQARVCTDDIVRDSDITSIVRSGGTAPGDPLTMTITANVAQITGFFAWAWGPNPTMTTQVVGRVEQPITTAGGYSC